jgi:hypothetical protein
VLGDRQTLHNHAYASFRGSRVGFGKQKKTTTTTTKGRSVCQADRCGRNRSVRTEWLMFRRLIVLITSVPDSRNPDLSLTTQRRSGYKVGRRTNCGKSQFR